MTNMKAMTNGVCSRWYNSHPTYSANNDSPAAFTVVRFDPTGRYVFVGTSNGAILVFHSRTKTVCDAYPLVLHFLILI